MAPIQRHKRNFPHPRDAGRFIRRARQRRGGQMKLIILDHLRRWRWILAACLIAYFAFQSSYTHKEYTQSSNDPTTASIQHIINAVHSMFVFQAVMWLGFLLVWDFQRGLPRVLTSLPV